MADKAAKKVPVTKMNVRIVAAILALVTFILTLRLVDMQIIKGDKYKSLATRSQWTVTKTPAVRGTITDADGNILAETAQTWSVYLIPEKFPNDKVMGQVCEDFANAWGIDAEETKEKLIAKLTDKEGNRITPEEDKASKVIILKQLELPEYNSLKCTLKGDKCDEKCRKEGTTCLYHKKYVYGDNKYIRCNEVLGFENDFKRYYPMGDYCSSLLGFVNIDGTGQYGIESYYNKTLAGTDGKTTSFGSNVISDNEHTYDVVNGSNLKLTIDSTIQYSLAKNLRSVFESSGAIGAYGIVMNVKTGAILGMDSVGYKGKYDVENPTELSEYYTKKLERAVEKDDFSYIQQYAKYASKADKEEAENKVEEIINCGNPEERRELHSAFLTHIFQMEQWNNYCVSEIYHPGSVFKIFLTAAVLEEHALEEGYQYCCNGFVNVDDRTFHCHVSSHGWEDLRKGLMNSCNPFYVTMGRKLGAERFFDYFEAFGFTKKTGIESLQESSSSYYSKEQLKRSPVSLASCSFGQSFSITPIQLVTAISCIANGGKLMKPYLVAAQYDDNGKIITETTPKVVRQVISEGTAKEVASMMEDVVKSGTGRNGKVAGYRVAGKTGTTQKYQDAGTYIASFGCFAPADDPEIAVLVIVDEPQTDMNGSTIAAPIAAKIVEDSLEHLGVERQYTDEELASLDTSTPGVLGKDISDAMASLEKKGFTVKVVGNGNKVLSQSPIAGQSIPKKGVIALYTTNEKYDVAVPDFTGMGISAVKRYAASEGLNVSISGITTGDVVAWSQSVPAETEVAYGTCINVSFKTYSGVSDGTSQ